MPVPSTDVGLSFTDWVGLMKSKPLSQADYMWMYRNTGDKEYLAEMIVEYGVMSHSKIAEEVAAAILEHLPNSDWENRHDFILLCYHMAKKENPDLGVDVVVDQFTNASTGVINVYAYQLADVAVAHAGAFNKVTLTA